MSTSTVGNNNLISNEEERYAAFLKNRNLDKTNANNREVVPANGIYVRFVKRIFSFLKIMPIQPLN